MAAVCQTGWLLYVPWVHSQTPFWQCATIEASCALMPFMQAAMDFTASHDADLSSYEWGHALLAFSASRIHRPDNLSSLVNIYNPPVALSPTGGALAVGLDVVLLLSLLHQVG